MEEKKMNVDVKVKYLDDFTKDLHAHTQLHNRLTGFISKYSAERNREMQHQTTHAIFKTLNKMKNIEEYIVKTLHGEEIRGPMKWLVLIFGPNHQAKDIRKLLA